MKRPKPDFSLTIINVVFLLLLFYLTTGSLIKQNELAANVPLTSDIPLERLPRPLLLITGDRSLFIDGTPVASADLPDAARQATANGKPLNILADRSMSGRIFLGVVAQLEAAGIATRIVTLHSDGRTGAAPP
jgi:biopolymer transport protein ExbD